MPCCIELLGGDAAVAGSKADAAPRSSTGEAVRRNGYVQCADPPSVLYSVDVCVSAYLGQHAEDTKES